MRLKSWWLGVSGAGALISVVELIRWYLLGVRAEVPGGYILFVAFAMGAFPIFEDRVMRAGFWSAFSTAFVLAWAKAEPTVQISNPWLVAAMAMCAGVGLIFFYYLVSQEGKFRVGWLPVLLMTSFGIAIAFISSAAGGPDWMTEWVENILHIQAPQSHEVVHIVRKTLHFSSYGTAALAAALVARDLGTGLARSWVAGLCWAVPIAVFDEVRQTTAKGRTGSPWDVMLDTGGMIVALTLFSIVTFISHARKRTSPR